MHGRCLLLSLICCAPQLVAQDSFEIHIYEYEPLWRGQYSLEAHLNMTTQGTGMRDGTLLPTERRCISLWSPLSVYRRTSPLGS